MMSESKEAIRFFEHLSKVFAGKTRARNSKPKERVGSNEFEPGRDPRSLGNVLNRSLSERGWTPIISRASVLEQWQDLVGPEVAAHSTPDIDQEVLLISCDSSAWATQLRLLKNDILSELLASFPDCGIEEIKVNGPSAPSFVRGPRSVKGRGPRDTYG
jgi:predicted nucleic acid-binding Zn ribbon protein